MAEKRMFTRKIIDSDIFLEMPLSAQALYFHLNMRADDDGFVNNPRKITKYINASDDDLKILLAKRFVIGFESGVIVIKHWRMHNTLKSDRYHPTDYQEEFAQLGIKPNKSYTDEPENMLLPTMPEPNQNDENNQEHNQKPSGPNKGSGSGNARKKDPVFVEFADGDDDLLKALEDFAKMRKETGSPMTARAKTMLLNKLRTFQRDDWIKILEQSIFHDWKGIFPLSKEAIQTQRQQKNGSKGAAALDALMGLHSQYEDYDE